METSGVTDIQSQFESQKGRNDFLTAEKVDDAAGLCLSGGGYRAMLFHAGALIRLNELSVLSRLQEISSVSGGSIAAGQLAAAWPRLRFDAAGKAENLGDTVIDPLVRFASVSLDIKAALSSMLPGRTAAETVAAAYDRHLFQGATLQDIPDKPRFTFMATNLQTGSGWRFAKAYAADHRVGRINAPRISLATVVAASSAFPPFLSPLRLTFEAGVVEPMAGADLHRSPFTEHAVLTDGGVYDNLGLERVWRRCRTILVSNAGLSTPEIGSPTGKWIGQIYRSLNLIQQAAENSRKRILFGVHNLGQRKVAYWDIGTAPSAFGLNDALTMAVDQVANAATMRTRLNAFSRAEIDLLLRIGYANADAALRARGLAQNSPPANFAAVDSFTGREVKATTRRPMSNGCKQRD